METFFKSWNKFTNQIKGGVNEVILDKDKN